MIVAAGFSVQVCKYYLPVSSSRGSSVVSLKTAEL